jgi:hypothetical protein
MLLSPYSQLYKLWADKYPYLPVKFMFTQNFNSQAYLKKYTKEIVIVHWKKDTVVDYKYWRELFEWLISKHKTFFTRKNGTHYDIFEDEVVTKKIYAFFSTESETKQNEKRKI